jgi:hypothetical protein
MHLENGLFLILLLVEHHCLVTRSDGIIILLPCLSFALYLSTYLFLTNFDLKFAYDEIRVVGELKKRLNLLVRVIHISEDQFALDDRVLDINRVSCGLKGHKHGLIFLLELAGVENLSNGLGVVWELPE